MNRFLKVIGLVFLVNIAGATKASSQEKTDLSERKAGTVKTAIGALILPAPDSTESVNKESKMVKWPEGKIPTASQGFQVT